MRLIPLLLITFLLATPFAAVAADSQPPAILSIIPGQGAAGTAVVISGSGFNQDSSLFLGIDEVPVKSVTANQLRFDIPALGVGNYALYIRQIDGTATKAYTFTIVPVKPTVASLTPDSISFCAAPEERQVSIRGKNFLEGAKVLFDGAVIKGNRISSEEMTFTAPQVPGGLHQVQVRNQEETNSTAAGLLITSRPEIHGVTQGNNYVNYYELLIEGENFQQGSSLYVDGKKISGQLLPGERDRLYFNDCRRLTYQRYPYDPAAKSFQLIVVNPNGEESSKFSVTAP
ncbi:MAG: transcription factor [Geobacter sp.]|nr:transcription factor [Geobacter sp.]